MKINSGDFNRRIKIFHRVPTGQIDELGSDETAEVFLMERWAKIEPRTGSLLAGRAADTMLSKTTHKITIRYTDKINYDCWIICQNHRFDIDYILDPDFSKTYLEIYGQEVL